MTEYLKKVFSDSSLLREKLGLFIQRPDKVEIYARAAENFFAYGHKNELKFAPTWSWFGFFFGGWFLMYRKVYLVAMLMIVLASLPFYSGFLLASILTGISGKYFVIKRFESYLDLQSDEALEKFGGFDIKWVVIVLLTFVFADVVDSIVKSLIIFSAF